jgi:hypothetical protein
MKKLIIITTAIIRGNYHNYSIGKFYKEYNNILQNYEVYHIINIDKPTNLIKNFTIYETINLFNNIIPSNIKKEYIINNDIGFLKAYKNLMKKIKELNLLSDDNFYWWLEDDWTNKNSYDFLKIANKLFTFKNSAFTLAENSSLGSFRAGPFMNGSYFNNFFNIEQLNIANKTCDPEKQVRRWLSGKNRKNGNKSINRRINSNNNKIQIILLVTHDNEIDYKNLNHWNYPGELFNKNIHFEFHILKIKTKSYYHSIINIKQKNYKLKKINFNNLKKIFDNEYIKYYHITPFIFYDIGRDFNEKYNLNKWLNIEDNTSYKELKLKNAYLGNWKNFKDETIRMNTKYTMNNKFNFSLILLIQILPYIYKNYHKHGIKINFNYYSHCYGNYPNFNLFNSILFHNYQPNIINLDDTTNDLVDLVKIYHNYCGKQNSTDNIFDFNSYGKNFKLAKKYFDYFFKLDDKIIKKKEKYLDKIKNKKTLGIIYGGTNKLNPINFNKLMNYIDNELLKNKYDNIFISTDRISYQKKIIESYKDNYNLIIIDKNLEQYNNKSINTKRLEIIQKNIKKIKLSADINERTINEMELKRACAMNTLYLHNYILDSLILSECDLVIKDHPDELALCKILNPDLNIKLLTKYNNVVWPDTHIELYSIYKDNEDLDIN